MSKPSRSSGHPPAEGLREQKRRETHQRIVDTALSLFLANGYEATTLDAIAAEAGISRRTFFAYFKSKDDILMSFMDAGWASMCADLLKTSPDVQPLHAVRDVMAKQISSYTTEEMTSLDNLMRSSESLLARKQIFYAEQEQALFATLCEVWRQPERQVALRMVAIVCIGAMKLTTQAWGNQSGHKKPMAEMFCEALASLKPEL
ncbi:TetR/AcrR family transcriptional regulator [Pseudomonas sp. SO81]|uniref:TetR/AcrR family transcriptional regulator n=1 Tax=Pseudomonas sp. SO81 TaxID=2983246 RepID=UPI0025A42914|nr:TetR/AcrR family transcriptional regulator [Pseudomonas sp. SO81]WJN61676.1 Transcriptional regulator, AcrR family [Pseudomonas sp. SO81]